MIVDQARMILKKVWLSAFEVLEICGQIDNVD